MVALSPVRPAVGPSRRAAEPREWPAAAAWLAFVTSAIATGTWFIDGSAVQLRAAPLYGHWSLPTLSAPMAATAGIAIVALWSTTRPAVRRAGPATNPAEPGALASTAVARTAIVSARPARWFVFIAAGLGAVVGLGGVGLVPAFVVAVVGVVWLPGVLGRCRWRDVPVVAGAAAVVWTVALAASAGWDAVTAPLVSRHEYEPFAAGIDRLGPFLASYVDRLAERPIHVQGHPPGPVVVAWVFDRVGLGGAGWLAALVLLAWGIAVAAALVAARAVAGEAAARRAAPALVLLPAAVWAGTSFDAVFAALVAVAIAALALAATRGSVPWALGAGVVAGCALLSSYGAVVALLPGVAVAVVLRCPARAWAAAAIGLVGPLLVAAAAGFWWLDGLAATRDRYWDGIGADRPALYLTLLGNPAALALASGPAVAVGLRALLRRRSASAPGGSLVDRLPANVRAPAAWLPLAALVAVIAADLSQMSRGEVERIWLPFVPFLALAAPGGRRGWLAAQAGVALVVQSTLISAW